MATHLKRLLESIVEAPETSLSDLEIVTEREGERIRAWNDTRREYGEGCVHRLFEERAKERPDAVALEHEGERMSYGELDERSNKVARYLRRRGVREGDIVGIYMERSLEMMVGIVGVVKAGGVYMPIDPGYPEERVRYMVRDSGARAVMSEWEKWGVVGGIGVEVIYEDREREEIGKERGEWVRSGVGLGDGVYVIYTSGSTGRPKGVMVEHGGLKNLVSWHNERFGVSGEDRATQLAGIGFDASVWEVWPYLVRGARVYLVGKGEEGEPERIRDWIVREGITISFVPTPLAEEMLGLEWSEGAALRVMLTGGDRMRRKVGKGIGFKVVNNYGPTENTVVTTSGEVGEAGEGERAEAPSIGRPIGNTKVYIVDRRGGLAPIGGIGELWVSGAGIARGYVNRPELTGERFREEGIGGEVERTYRTGDMGRYRGGGEIEFLGRIDEQVKVRGYRIELGEVEVVMREHPFVEDVVVRAWRGESGENRLVGYIVAEEGKEEGIREEMRRYMRGRVPEYMVPAHYVLMEEIPLTANGKVDRGALPEPEWGGIEGRRYEEPRGRVEEVLVKIWGEVLGVEKVGRGDNFFELGGDSILSIQVVSRARGEGIRVSTREMFRYQSIGELSGHIEEIGEEEGDRGLEFGAAGISEEELEEVLGWIGEEQRAELEAIYPLSPMQEGILYHALEGEGTDVYIEQICFRVEGEVEG